MNESVNSTNILTGDGALAYMSQNEWPLIQVVKMKLSLI